MSALCAIGERGETFEVFARKNISDTLSKTFSANVCWRGRVF
jgi:hypothetical protein